MDLEDLLLKTKTEAIYLINSKGDIIDSSSEETVANHLHEKITAFNAVVFNMSEHFFETFLKSELTEVVLKAKNKTIILIKRSEYILCFLSDKRINLSLLELTLKNQK